MLFCEQCGSLMMPNEDRSGFVCACGHKVQGPYKVVEQGTETKDIEVIEKEEKDINPITDAKCPRCEHDKAHYWTVQTRAADEAPTRFFKCEKCKKTWRET